MIKTESEYGFCAMKKTCNFLVFFIVSFYAIACMWPEVGSEYVERGDFAANSLLIMDAKNWSLLVGHYSRVGFNHPSPVLLYLFSFAEIVLHDKLGLVKSPFSAHLVFVGLFNGFWITVTSSVIANHLKNYWLSLAVVAIYLLAINYFEPGSIVGPWFPHMYIFLYGALLVLMASFISGDSKSYILMLVSALFLAGTNVSMAPQLIIMFATLLLWMLFTEDGRESLRRALNRNNALATVLLMSIFFAPLVYVCVAYGYKSSPIYGYLSYGAGKNVNGLHDAFLYVVNFWNGYTSIVFAVCGMVLASGNASVFVRNFFVIILFATFSFCVYARLGIDDLQHRYLGLYYYAAVAMALSFVVYSAVVLSLSFLTSPKMFAGAKIGFLLVAIIAVLVQPRPIPGNASLYNSDDGRFLFDYIKSLNSNKTIVFDLDQADDPSYVWGNFLGFLVLAKRDGLENFCIRKNWHISYTKKYKCPDSVYDYEAVVVSKKSLDLIIKSGYSAGNLHVQMIHD